MLGTVPQTLYLPSTNTSAFTQSLGLWTLFSVRNSTELEKTTFRKLELFPSWGEGMETSTLLGPLERANLHHCTRLHLSRRPNRADVSFPPPDDGNRSRLRNVGIYTIYNSIWWTIRLLSKNEKITSYKAIILPVVLYWRESCSSTLIEEQRLRVFENRVLRRIFGPKRDGVTEGWKKLHNVELHDLYSSRSIIKIIKSRRMRWAGHVAWMEKKTCAGCW
jgi:hypothetical protein